MTGIPPSIMRDPILEGMDCPAWAKITADGDDKLFERFLDHDE